MEQVDAAAQRVRGLAAPALQTLLGPRGADGVRGDEPGFDKTSVVTYGLALEGSGEGFGQTE